MDYDGQLKINERTGPDIREADFISVMPLEGERAVCSLGCVGAGHLASH